MQEGTIARWLKQPGDQLQKGDIIAEVETDKATMDVEVYDSGVLEQILVKEGETVPIGQVIALIGSGSGSASPTPTQSAPQKPAPAPAPQQQNNTPQATPQPVQNGTPQAPAGPNTKVSPLARRMAEEHGIDLSRLQGTGPGGRIVRDDIEDYLEQRSQQPQIVAAQQPTVQAAPAPDSGDEIVALTQMQKTVARRLSESKQNVPHFYVSNEVDMTNALVMRQKLNASASEPNSIKISVNDLIIKACALALERFPEVNSSLQDGQFVRHKAINIGVAIDVPNGLVVPVLHNANIKGLRTIARESRALIERARNNRLTPNDFQGGTFSISNLGMMDVTDFIPIVNPPDAAILAVASVRQVYVPVDGQPLLRDIVKLTVSADHRIIYGATVARFLAEVKRLLQDVYLLLG
jgi:pyruvate dehydrogenase E2 component (dihydrolipoamide acetyltransferase)